MSDWGKEEYDAHCSILVSLDMLTSYFVASLLFSNIFPLEILRDKTMDDKLASPSNPGLSK